MKFLGHGAAELVFRRNRSVLIILLLLVASLLVAGFSLSLSSPMRPATNGWTFSFPRDHGKHGDFEVEWWYVSGNLNSSDGKEWGYQFVIFRRALVHRLGSQTIFRMPFDGYAGHLVITDITERKHKFFQRQIGSFLNLAGADTDQLRVWLRSWRLEEKDGRILLQADQDDCSLSLELFPGKNPVLHDIKGFETKGEGPPRVSHNYSITSLRTIGQLKWQGNVHSVEGKSWLDREFGTGITAPDLRGWDWFSLGLGNGFEVMVIQIRLLPGDATVSALGTIVFPDGTYRNLKQADFQVSPVDFWTSPQTKACYPMGWEMTIPSLGLKLAVTPAMRDHEILASASTGVDYWEGPVRVSGSMNDQAVSGKGYVELVGYVQSVGGMF